MGCKPCVRSVSVDSVYSYVGNSTEKIKMEKNSCFSNCPLWKKILFFAGLALFSLLLLAFLLIWIVFPLVFMNTLSLQRYCMFFNFQDPKNPEFNNFQKYGMDGIVNFYVTTKEEYDASSLLSIGAWLVLPESQIQNGTINYKNITASVLLQDTTYPILIYLHGVACNRIKPKETYDVLRKHFIIVSLDHRGYGDSSNVPPSELGIVNDTAQIFKWIRAQTTNDIYIWGHSLGSALGTHTVKYLNEVSDIVPMGLILESAFTTMREEVLSLAIVKIFKWLPWFETTMLAPLEQNGFLFKTTTNILSVVCPIMILHAEDDNVIPYTLGKRLAEVAETQRTIPPQGNVTYHQFGRLGYQHTGITSDPNMSKYIKEFIGFCKDQNKSLG